MAASMKFEERFTDNVSDGERFHRD